MKSFSIVKILFLLLFFSLLYAPLITFIIYSFNISANPLIWDGFTFEWYKTLLIRKDLLVSLVYSIIIGIFTVVTVLGFSLLCILGVFLNQAFAKTIYLIQASVFIPEIVFAVSLLLLFTVLEIPLGIITLVIAHSVMGIGYAFPLIYERFKSIDYRLIEASYDLGATTWQVFKTIILPSLKAVLISAGLLVFILSFDDFLLAFFCSGSEIQTLPLALLSMLRIGITPDFNALATLLFMACVTAVALYFYLYTKKNDHFANGETI